MKLEHKSDKHQIWYAEQEQILFFTGTLRLSGIEEYNALNALLEEIVKMAPKHLTINLERLEFLNSSGISVLSRFVISIRKLNTTALEIYGSSKIAWQSKSLPNLKKLFPAIELIIK